MQSERDLTSRSITSNVIWRLAERIGAQGVNFIVSVILTRILSPEEYGIISMTTVFTTILSVFVTSGLGTALVQRHDIDDLDCSTALWANIGIGAILYLLVFAAAPLISRLYEQPLMTPVLRVLSLTLIIGGLNAIQHARISRKMQFKSFFKATLVGTITSAFVGIGMALSGCGVWSLVGQHLSNQIVNTFTLWVIIKWKPSFVFSWKRLKPIFSFGSRAYGASLIETLYNNLRSLLIGSIYSADQLAFYNRGRHIPAMINQNTNNAIQSVIFPVYSKVSDDKPRMLQMMRRAISLGSYIIFPCMMGMAVVAEPLIAVMYTEKWLPCVPYLQMACFVYALTPMHKVNLQAILAIGRSDIALKRELFKKAITVSCLIVCVNISMYATAFSAMPLGVFALIVNAFPVKKHLGYSLLCQIKDVTPALVLSLVMGAAVYAVGLLIDDMALKLMVQILVGITVYLGLSILIKNRDFLFIWKYIRDTVKKFCKKK